MCNITGTAAAWALLAGKLLRMRTLFGMPAHAGSALQRLWRWGGPARHLLPNTPGVIWYSQAAASARGQCGPPGWIYIYCTAAAALRRQAAVVARG